MTSAVHDVMPETRKPGTGQETSSEDNFFKLLPQFFLIPLAVVAVCVGVFLFFGSIAFEAQTLDQLISTLETRTGTYEQHPRWQAAYELTQRLTRQGEVLSAEQEVRLVRLFLNGQLEPDTRGFLAATLGFCASAEAERALLDGLGDTTPEVRRLSANSLGRRYGREGRHGAAEVEPIARLLADADRMTRSFAVGALGAVGGPEAAQALRGVLDDAAGDVRLNAALALSQLGDPAGVPLLLQALEPQSLQSLADYKPDQALAATESAIHALADLRAQEAVSTLTRVQETHPDFRMRQAARDALARITNP